MPGIKETTELMVAVNEVALFLVKTFKDGVDVGDFIAIWEKVTKDEEFKKVLEDAYKGYNLIPAEVKDLNLLEVADLVKLEMEYVAKIMDELKNKQKTPADI